MSIYGDSIFLNEGLFSKYREKKNKQFAINVAKKVVKDTAKWIKSPESLGPASGDPDELVLWLYSILYSFDELVKYCNKNKNKFYTMEVKSQFFPDEDNKVIINKFIKIFGENAITILFDDDWGICLGLNGKLYFVNVYDNIVEMLTYKKMIDILDPDNIVGQEESFLDYCKQADKELGTNLFKEQ